MLLFGAVDPSPSSLDGGRPCGGGVTSKIRLAAVGDSGALAPVARVARVLEPRVHPPAAVVVTIEPSCPLEEPLAAIRSKLVAGEIDVALCPGCRLPLGLPPGLDVGAVLRCRDPRYRFISLIHPDLSLMPRGAKVVVCDASARAQILHRFPSLRVEMSPPSEAISAGLRHGVWDAACVGAEIAESDPALAEHASPVPADEIVPCIGQGIVVVLLPAAEGRLRDSLRVLNDPAVEHCFRVERAFLSRVSGIAKTTAAARATQSEGRIELTGVLAEENGSWLVADHAHAPSRFGETIALEIADACRKAATGRSARARRAPSLERGIPLSGPRPADPSAPGSGDGDGDVRRSGS
jgi:hydroxymethylbilane synthase